jgi:hypothetical protein
VASEAPHFSSVVNLFLLGSLRDEGGEALVRAVLEEAGEARIPDQLCDPMHWCSYDHTRRLFESARRVTGNRARLFRAGRHAIRSMASSAPMEMFQAIGSPAALLTRSGELTSMMSTIVTSEAMELGPYDWLTISRMDPGFEPFRDWCWFEEAVRHFDATSPGD